MNILLNKNKKMAKFNMEENILKDIIQVRIKNLKSAIKGHKENVELMSNLPMYNLFVQKRNNESLDKSRWEIELEYGVLLLENILSEYEEINSNISDLTNNL
jgi:tRNA1(Val) A37 N6-methylase TrmN6